MDDEVINAVDRANGPYIHERAYFRTQRKEWKLDDGTIIQFKGPLHSQPSMKADEITASRRNKDTRNRHRIV